jgi:hypothetical protein
MNLTSYLWQACSLPPHEAFRRATRRVAWILHRDLQRRRDREDSTTLPLTLKRAPAFIILIFCPGEFFARKWNGYRR